jgi:hypothetical protein
MVDLAVMILFDESIIISMLILAYLSRKMGDALKIRPYYVILYIAAALIAAACGIDITVKAFSLTAAPLVSLVMRACAGVAALAVCLRYWSWLFSEFFGV